MKRYNLAIVGAGPAGSLCALGLAKSLRRKHKAFHVLWVDKRSLLIEKKAGYIKSCGGLLEKRAQDALAKYHLAIPKEVLSNPQPFSLEGIDLENRGIRRLYRKPYINMNRFAFDHWLWTEAMAQLESCGIEVDFVPEATVFRVEKNQDGWELSYRDTKAEESWTIETDMIAGCDGATSRIRMKAEKEEGRAHPIRRYATISECYSAGVMPTHYTAVFDRKVSDMYSWVIPKDGKLLVGSASRADDSVHARYNRFKEDLIKLGYKLDKPEYRLGAVVLRPYPIGSVFDGNGTLFLAGEAAGLVSPSGLEGISFALRSGMSLGQALGAGFKCGQDIQKIRKTYLKALRPLRLSIFFMSFKSPIMYHKLPRGLVFKSGLLSIHES